MILLLDALETGNLKHIRHVEQAYVVFKELQDNGLHKLAELAVEKLSWGLDRLRLHLETIRAPHPPNYLAAPILDKADPHHLAPCFHDTVMGNTGMLLLEDPGLQSHTSEHFSPLTWVLTGAESEASISSHSRDEQEQRYYGKTSILNGVTLQGSIKSALALKELQDTAGSPQDPMSGSNRASRSKTMDQSQHCATRLGPPMSLAESINRAQHPRQDPSPHLQNRNVRRVTPPSTITQNDSSQLRLRGGGEIRTPKQHASSVSKNRQQQMSVAQLRHNSCPVLHPFATTPPLLRSTHSSPLSNGPQSPISTERCSINSHWSGNPAVPVLHSLDAGMLISPMSDQGHGDLFGNYERQQHVAHPHIFTYSTATTGSDELPAMTGQHMNIDEWK